MGKNGAMSIPFAARGAIDLSTLAPQPSAPPAPTGASYVTEVDEASFEATIRLSVQHPVVMEFYSSRAPEQAALSKDLADIADASGGTFLLARVNVDTSPRVAQALQIQAVPTVVGILGGQLVPLWQGTLSRAEAQAYIAELLKVAASNGIVGRAQPVSVPDVQDGPDPRYDAAYAAMEAGDFALAEKEFTTLLDQNAADEEARAGKAQAGLLGRVGALDPAAVAARLAADPSDLDAVCDQADLHVSSGDAPAAFSLLIQAVRDTTGADRDRVRTRLLDLFETVGPSDPIVLKARRELATALF